MSLRVAQSKSPAVGGAVAKTRAYAGAGNETRTRDPDLGKVVLYQLSYSRVRQIGKAAEFYVHPFGSQGEPRCIRRARCALFLGQ